MGEDGLRGRLCILISHLKAPSSRRISPKDACWEGWTDAVRACKDLRCNFRAWDQCANSHPRRTPPHTSFSVPQRPPGEPVVRWFPNPSLWLRSNQRCIYIYIYEQKSSSSNSKIYPSNQLPAVQHYSTPACSGETGGRRYSRRW